MKTTLKQYKVSDIVKGFIYNEAEGKVFLAYQVNELFNLNIKETISMVTTLWLRCLNGAYGYDGYVSTYMPI